jgi:hypothetical protein
MKVPTWSLWLFSFLLAVTSAIYQRVTGPTYAVRGSATIAGEDVRFRLPRSYAGPGDADVKVLAADPAISGWLELRRYRSHDAWQSEPMTRRGDTLVGHLPHQPPAGKVMYRIWLQSETGEATALTERPIILRFRGDVPAWIVIPHIVLIFAGMLLSTRTGLEALRKGAMTFRLSIWTLIGLALGGLVFGPIMQWYAFGAFWTGWPYGHDLTDNKLAAVVVLWVIACWRLWAARKRNKLGGGWAIAAAVATLVAWFIPHSLLGSELDFTKLPEA